MAEGQHRHQYVVTMQMTVTCSTSLQLPRHRELKWRLCPAILTKGENTEMVPFNQVPLLTEHVLVTQLYLTFCDPWTVPCQTPLSMGFSRQEYWSHSLLQGIFLTQGSNPCLLHQQAGSVPSYHYLGLNTVHIRISEKSLCVPFVN